MAHVIVSYDGTRDDRDALALGKLFAKAGAQVSLAYVRHAPEPDPARELEVQGEAERLLAVGANELDGASASVGKHVIVNPSTADGLAALAGELGADVIAFSSSYRTPAGRVELPHTAEQLLDLGIACSLALAPAGLAREPGEQSIASVGVYEADGDRAASESAKSLASALGAVVSDEHADLLVVASRGAAPAGELSLSGIERERIEQARSPVLMLARGAQLSFG